MFEISPERLNRKCDPDSLTFVTTSEVAPLEGMIGQKRALSALELALDMQEPGFNLYISGPPGTGRNRALAAHIEQAALARATPPDWGYVYNFHDYSQPQAISLPSGRMGSLAADMDDLVDSVRREVPQAFESDDYSQRMDAAMQGVNAQREALTATLDEAAEAAGFAISFTPTGFNSVPVRNGQPLSNTEFAALTEVEQESIKEKAVQLQSIINRTLGDMRRLNKEAVVETRRVDREVVLFTLTPIIDELQEKYADHPDVVTFLTDVETDMVNHLDVFKPQSPAMGGDEASSAEDDIFHRYRVNVLVDNAGRDNAPVVFEQNPTYRNLFGHIDYRARMGTLVTDHAMVKGGAIHEANGGFLVIQAQELLSNPFSWQTLKRILRTGELRIENMGEQYSALPTSTLRPGPIPINIRIVLIGTPEILRFLQMADDDFRLHFKVIAHFDTVMERTPETVLQYAAFISAQCHSKGFLPFHKSAVARVIDHSSRLAEHQDKLTTRFSEVVDILTEANHWAQSSGNSLVLGDHVEKAIAQRRYRSSLAEERHRELITDDVFHIATEGDAVGQINGLAVLSFGEALFGRPSRITARVSLGRGQMINVERETNLSGRFHDKGFMVLTGYLRGKYGQDKPLSLTASIGFEQSYNEVDGDSASCAELYALLSAIAGIPVAQGIAVTGSVDQYGNVQAIGGVTEKIEGFFEVCKAKGFTSRQGVLIPRDNLKHLTLNDDVVTAVEEGRFHIYAVSTIDEGIEALTDVPAGEPDTSGAYPEGTLHHAVEQRLRELATTARDLAGSSLDGRDPETAIIS